MRRAEARWMRCPAWRLLRAAWRARFNFNLVNNECSVGGLCVLCIPILLDVSSLKSVMLFLHTVASLRGSDILNTVLLLIIALKMYLGILIWKHLVSQVRSCLSTDLNILRTGGRRSSIGGDLRQSYLSFKIVWRIATHYFAGKFSDLSLIDRLNTFCDRLVSVSCVIGGFFHHPFAAD